MIITSDCSTRNTNGHGGKADSRKRIVSAAICEFAENGYDRASTDRMAKAANVSKGTVFYHFATKERLYKYLLQSFLSLIHEQLGIRLSRCSSLVHMLHEVIYTQSSVLREAPEFISILRNELANPHNSLSEELMSAIRSDRLMEPVLEKIREGIGTGELRDVDEVQALVSFQTMSLGFLIMAPMFGSILKEKDPVSFVKNRKYAVVDLFMNGINAR